MCWNFQYGNETRQWVRCELEGKKSQRINVHSLVCGVRLQKQANEISTWFWHSDSKIRKTFCFWSFDCLSMRWTRYVLDTRTFLNSLKMHMVIVSWKHVLEHNQKWKRRITKNENRTVMQENMHKDSTSLTIASALPALFRLSTNSLLLFVAFFSRIEVQRSRLARRLAVVLNGVVDVVVAAALTTWGVCAWTAGVQRAGDEGWLDHSNFWAGLLPRITSGESEASPWSVKFSYGTSNHNSWSSSCFQMFPSLETKQKLRCQTLNMWNQFKMYSNLFSTSSRSRNLASAELGLDIFHIEHSTPYTFHR